MPELVPQLKLYPYDGSQDATKHPLLISPKDIVDSNNIIYTTYSTKKQRPGIREAFTVRPAGNNHILGGVDYWRLGSQRVVYYDGNRIYALTPGGVQDDISGSFTIPVDETVSFEKLAGLLIIFFGGKSTAPKKWTQSGSITDLSPNAPNSPFGRVYLNSLWIPDPDVPGRLLKSNTGDPTDFIGGDAASYDLDINDGDPDGITAIFPPFFDSLYVAKRYSIYRLTPVYTATGDFVFQVVKISDGVGCISHNAAIAVESSIIFPSDRGVHILDSSNKLSAVQTQFLSEPIQPVWFDETNFNRSQYMNAVYDIQLNSYLLFFPRQGRNYSTDVWGYSIPASKWYRWRSYNHTSAWRYVDAVNKKIRTMVGSQKGDFGIIDQRVTKDYGVGFSLFFESGIIAPGDPDNRFQFKSLAPIFVPQEVGTFSITYKINGRKIEKMDFNMVSDELGDPLGEDFTVGISVLGGLPQVSMETRRTYGSGNFYSMLVEHIPTESNPENFNEDFEFLGILVEVEPITKVTGKVVA